MRNRIALVVSAMLLVALLVGLTTSASAGAGDQGATVAKKKKKVCPAGTHKVTVKKKNGKKKKKCVADSTTPTPPPATTTLTISPTTFAFPDVQHGTCSAPPDPDCTVQTFTVTNTGGAASGVAATSIVETNNPIPGDPPGFVINGNTCTATVPPGGSCTVSAYFRPTSNANPQPYTAVLHVAATPGGDAQAALSGTAN